jgi:hypothetical protein
MAHLHHVAPSLPTSHSTLTSASRGSFRPRRSSTGTMTSRNNPKFDLEKGFTRGMTDIPRLRQGAVGGQFWSICVPCLHSAENFSTPEYSDMARDAIRADRSHLATGGVISGGLSTSQRARRCQRCVSVWPNRLFHWDRRVWLPRILGIPHC